MDRVEPKLPFPKETRVSTTSIHNAVNPQYTKYQQSRMSTGFITGRIEQLLDRAHKVRYNTACKESTQHSSLRSNSTQPTQEHHEDGLHTRLSPSKIDQQRTTRVWQSRAQSPQARGGLNRFGGKSTYIAQCMARRQPRKPLNYYQWVGRTLMFRIVALPT